MKKIFYGWRVVGAGGALQFLQSVLLNSAFGVYVAVLVEERGWSKTALSGAAALKSTEVALLGPILGWLVDRFGSQGMVRFGVIAFGIGFMLLSRIDTLIGFIEMLLNAHPMVEQAIVSGVGQAQPYALVVLAEALRSRLADAALRERVEAALSALLREVNATLAAHERLQRLVVAPEPWSIDNGCLTPTLKIKRSRIEAGVAASVDGWYKRPSPVVWA